MEVVNTSSQASASQDVAPTAETVDKTIMVHDASGLVMGALTKVPADNVSMSVDTSPKMQRESDKELLAIISKH